MNLVPIKRLGGTYSGLHQYSFLDALQLDPWLGLTDDGGRQRAALANVQRAVAGKDLQAKSERGD